MVVVVVVEVIEVIVVAVWGSLDTLRRPFVITVSGVVVVVEVIVVRVASRWEEERKNVKNM